LKRVTVVAMNSRNSFGEASSKSPAKGEPKGEVRFQISREKHRTGKQLFREGLLSSNGMSSLYQTVKGLKLHTSSEGSEAANLKKYLWHVRHWQHELYPRMQFTFFVDYLKEMKTFKTDIDQVMLIVDGEKPQMDDMDNPVLEVAEGEGEIMKFSEEQKQEEEDTAFTLATDQQI